MASDVVAGEMVTLVATGVGGACITFEPSELQTAKAGAKAISANWRAIRFDSRDRFGMVSYSSPNGDSAMETKSADAGQQNAAAAPTVLRRIRWRLGWRGG
jgi:hypothetical protein